MIMIRFMVRFVSCYAHVFVLLSIVIVTKAINFLKLPWAERQITARTWIRRLRFENGRAREPSDRLHGD